jgi:hypothetical protein
MKTLRDKKKRVWTHIRNTICGVSVSCVFLFFGHESVADESLCAMAPEALREASRLRGLSPKSEVPCQVQERAGVEAFLRNVIQKKYPPHKLAMEGYLYRTLGVIPEGYDYENGVIAAYVGQIGGYYDPEKKRFIVVDSIPKRLQQRVSVHELTHALQDQYYDLDRFLDPRLESGDELMAHAAVAEGDANLVMQEAFRGRKTDSDGDNFGLDGEVDQRSPEIPESLREMLLFPYEQGLQFVKAVQKRGGAQARERLFQRPPRSTRDILHPEKFLDGGADLDIPSPRDVMKPEIAEATWYNDTIGEFGISTILASELSNSEVIRNSAQGWIGDRAVVVPARNGYGRVVWLSRWETNRDAKEFSAAYRETLENRYGKTFQGDAITLSDHKTATVTVAGHEVRVVFTLRQQA